MWVNLSHDQSIQHAVYAKPSSDFNLTLQCEDLLKPSRVIAYLGLTVLLDNHLAKPFGFNGFIVMAGIGAKTKEGNKRIFSDINTSVGKAFGYVDCFTGRQLLRIPLPLGGFPSSSCRGPECSSTPRLFPESDENVLWS